MSENTHGNRTQLATTRLRHMIVAGELAPGQRISEREIGEQLDGISRTPLREAFKVLAAEGLVTISPNRGASVTALSMAEVDETIELLVGLEGLAAETACSRISEQDIAAIDELHQHMAAAYRAGQLMAYFELNQAIHQRVVDAAGNRVLSRIYAGARGSVVTATPATAAMSAGSVRSPSTSRSSTRSRRATGLYCANYCAPTITSAGRCRVRCSRRNWPAAGLDPPACPLPRAAAR